MQCRSCNLIPYVYVIINEKYAKTFDSFSIIVILQSHKYIFSSHHVSPAKIVHRHCVCIIVFSCGMSKVATVEPPTSLVMATLICGTVGIISVRCCKFHSICRMVNLTIDEYKMVKEEKYNINITKYTSCLLILTAYENKHVHKLFVYIKFINYIK